MEKIMICPELCPGWQEHVGDNELFLSRVIVGKWQYCPWCGEELEEKSLNKETMPNVPKPKGPIHGDKQ